MTFIKINDFGEEVKKLLEYLDSRNIKINDFGEEVKKLSEYLDSRNLTPLEKKQLCDYMISCYLIFTADSYIKDDSL